MSRRKRTWRMITAWLPVSREWRFRETGDGHNVVVLRLLSVDDQGRAAEAPLSPDAARLLAAHLVRCADRADAANARSDREISPYDEPLMAVLSDEDDIAVRGR